jgi:hypothetical protein
LDKIGRYEIIEELGRGTAGTVYKAFDPTISRLVAIKVLSLPSSRPVGCSGSASSNDPLREARISGSLEHACIVTIHDAVEDKQNKLYYIVMEYVAGCTLERVLAENPFPPLSQVLHLTSQTAEALEYAHHRQIIHRDLKPANILITDQGQVKIADFGIAKMASLEATVSTMALAGTPSYMSPEQVTGGKLDGRSDLFSLGIILYEMLTGQRPFSGALPTVMFKTVYEEIVPLRDLKPEIPAEIEKIALRCLAKDPRQRYATASDLLADLAKFQAAQAGTKLKEAASSHVATETAVAATRPVGSAPPAGADIARHGAQKIRDTHLLHATGRRRRIILAALSAAFILAATAGLLYHRYGINMAAIPPPAPLSSNATLPPAWLAGEAPAGPARNAPALKAPGGTAGAGSERLAARRNVSEQSVAGPNLKTRRPHTATSEGAAVAPAPTRGSGQAARSSAVRLASAQPGALAPVSASSTESVRIICQYHFAKGVLTLSNADRVLFRQELAGKKKRRILFIGGGYEGRLEKSIAIPVSVRRIMVRVSSLGGGWTFTKNVPIKLDLSSHSKPTLNILVDDGHLHAEWLEPASATP